MTPPPQEQQAPLPEPAAYMTREAQRRLADGGNSKGAVPVHLKRSNVACIPLFTADQMREAAARIAELEAEVARHESEMRAIWLLLGGELEFEAWRESVRRVQRQTVPTDADIAARKETPK